MYETSGFFYSAITFSYTKYFVRSYTVDVVFTLSFLWIWLLVIRVAILIKAFKYYIRISKVDWTQYMTGGLNL